MFDHLKLSIRDKMLFNTNVFMTTRLFNYYEFLSKVLFINIYPLKIYPCFIINQHCRYTKLHT